VNDFLRIVNEKLNNLEVTANGEHIKTIEIRKKCEFRSGYPFSLG
jgi:hypothetical protein